MNLRSDSEATKGFGKRRVHRSCFIDRSMKRPMLELPCDIAAEAQLHTHFDTRRALTETLNPLPQCFSRSYTRVQNMQRGLFCE